MTDDPYKRLRRRPMWASDPFRSAEPVARERGVPDSRPAGPRRIEVSENGFPREAAPAAVHDAPTRPTEAPPRATPTAEPPEMGANAERIDALLNALEHQQELTRVEMVRARQAELELEKAKERIEREAARNLEQGKRFLLLGFLEVIDDLDRAIAAADTADGDRAVLEGIELVRKSFHRKLGEHGVRHRPSMGQRFDPALHEAVSMVPVDDPERDGEIIAVVREGYDIGGDVLRPASVAVAKAK